MGPRENIQVAIRIRPKLLKDIEAKASVITRVTPGEPQVSLNKESFTFDHVFDIDSQQDQIYQTVVSSLVDGCFDGFNATIFAYGQTGSGKTHTMGTSFDLDVPENDRGVIPRAFNHIFQSIQQRRQLAVSNQLPPPEFTITAQFVEIYNEELRDLLCGLDDNNSVTSIQIVEDAKNGIVLKGACKRSVLSVDDALDILKRGSLFRTTGATKMNSVSSRSHAIFTLFLHQNRYEANSDNSETSSDGEWVRITAKFNFVDLAGSERLSRTGAKGDRLKEGIKINSGLLHLGTVISKLGDPAQKTSFVNYRDSKLTRILQDSLGGNSVTTMIACISPCDRDFLETLNTLRYANRAKNIKNKAVANQDSNSQLISELKKRIAQLEFENDELRQGKGMVGEGGAIQPTDLYLDYQMLKNEKEVLTVKVKTLSQRYNDVNEENIRLNAKIKSSDLTDGDSIEEIVKGYLEDISRLELKLQESENMRNFYQSRYMSSANPVEDEDYSASKTEVKYIRECLEKFNQSMSYNAKQDIANNSAGSSESGEEDSDEFSDEQDEKKDLISEEHETSMQIQGTQLANLITMIEDKERLINDFEERSKKYRNQTENYERKISEFKQQIKEIEKERDALLKKMTDENKTKKIREMEKEVDLLQRELKRYERLKQQHQNLLQADLKIKEEVKKIRQEVIEAKAKRIQIIQEMKKAQSNFQKATHKQKIEMNRLINQDVKKNLQINNLQAESRQQKAMIKRKNEEIVNLKKRNMENGRVMNNKFKTPRRRRLIPQHTPQKVKTSWEHFEKILDDHVKNKLQLEYEEIKLNNYYNKRYDCVKLLEDVSDDHEYIEDLKQNLEFIEKNIEDCQNVICGLDPEDISLDPICSDFTFEEFGYFFNKLTRTSINYAILSWQREAKIREKENIIKELHNEIHRLNVHLEYFNKFIQPDIEARKSSGKRRAMRSEELLFYIEKTENSLKQTDNSDNSLEDDKSDPLEQTLISNSTRLLKANCEISNAPLKKLSMNTLTYDSKLNGSNGENDNSQSQMPPPSIQSLLSPRLTRRKVRPVQHSMLPVLESNINTNPPNNAMKVSIVRSSSINNGHSSNGLQNGKDGYSPHSSPLFPRHTKNVAASIRTENFPLICTSEIFAHGKAILSICATEDYIISGSRDCSAVIWNLETGARVCTFTDNDIVNVVRYHEANKQLFTVSNTVIKIYDPREGSLIKMITPSGLTMQTDSYSSGQSIMIDDIQISQCGNYLYYTCDRIVKVCDLRNYQNVAKFNSGHNSKITCIALAENSDFSGVLATGSKDHNVKLFDVENPPSGNNTPKLVLKPPHYDGVEALKMARNGSILFSGGRDGYIKKYDLQTEKLNSNFGNFSNGIYVCSLDLILNETVLVSGYRNGVLKLWSVETSTPLGETLAHPNSEVRSIATNSKQCYTAGIEGCIKYWAVPEDSSLITNNIN